MISVRTSRGAHSNGQRAKKSGGSLHAGSPECGAAQTAGLMDRADASGRLMEGPEIKDVRPVIPLSIEMPTRCVNGLSSRQLE